MSSHDPSSYAEPEKVVITHVALDLNVDFAKKVLAGSTVLDLDWKDPAATTLVLDTRDLDIASAEGLRRRRVGAGEVRAGGQGQDLRQQAQHHAARSRRRRCASTTPAAPRPPACSG
jgi:aminopeptidase N